jgi:predicted O-methyltransferase YrrM
MIKMDLISCKTKFKSYFPVKNLIKKPEPDATYLFLYRKYLPKMHESNFASEIDSKTLSWIDTLALQTQVSIKKSHLDWTHGYFLYKLILEQLKNSKKKEITVFESGTAKGFSSLVMAKAICDAKKIPKILTIDLIDGNKSMYWNALGDERGRKTRPELLYNYQDLLKYIEFKKLRSSKLKVNSYSNIFFDIAFLDAAHTFKDVKKEFQIVEKRLNNGGIIIFDDYDLLKYPGIVKFINSLDKNRITLVKSNLNYKAFAVYK